VLRAAVKDYKKIRHREELDKSCKRATPKMWSSYITSSIVIKISRDGYPVYLKEQLEKTCYTERRQPHKPRFYDASKGKIGRHKIENRLDVMDNIGWNTTGPNSDDAIRTMLKKSLNFNFD